MKKRMMFMLLLLITMIMYCACGNTTDTPAKNSSGTDIEGLSSDSDIRDMYNEQSV